PALRRLLRDVPDYVDLQLGLCTHVALYDEFFAAVDCSDNELLRSLRSGFPIVGEIQRSGRWPPFSKPQKPVPVQEALARAWEMSLWESTLEDVKEASTVGPFGSEEEVSEFLGCSDWIPTQRFEVVQKNKVRGCDSATSNLINQTAVITEKLELTSTDLHVAVLRELRTRGGDRQLQGWVLDERKAYRQLPIAPHHRKFSVICLKDPSDGVPKFFVMIGHSFGLVAAVYNYNRRSAMINDIFVKLFNMVAFNFYDDRYGFETDLTSRSARTVAECVHFWLGALFDDKKLQLSFSPVILGVTFNLELLVLEIKDQRRKELTEMIDGILETGSLDPGTAGKLKGKLMFGASQLWGKADVVIFTDGFTPDQRKSEIGDDRIGAVMFDRRAAQPKQFSEVIPTEVSERWISRKTQIVPIEMIAPILALETFRDHVKNKDVLLLIDSEAVE
ncbi:unnamed protein product, partial [Symbiodinium necroappetens]